MKKKSKKANNRGKAQKTLKQFLKDVIVEKPLKHENLTLVPLRGEGRGQLNYLLGEQAIKTGKAEVKEIGESGSVPELAVINKSDEMILFLDGEELIGAKQNRILNTSIMLAPHSKTIIPVSCVEQGRWHARSSKFSVGAWAPSKLRSAKIKDVARNIAETGQARSDQGKVWSKVREYLNSVQADSPTMAMHDAVEKRKHSLDEYVNALKYPGEICGIISVIDEQFEAMDLFDRNDTLEYLWPRLIKGYAMDAIIRKERQTLTHKAKAKAFSRKAGEILLEHISELECGIYPSVGIGEEWRFEANDVIGQGLIVDEICVHLSAFPNEDENRNNNDLNSSYISPPSRRRRFYIRDWKIE